LSDYMTLFQDAGSNPVDPTLSADLNTLLTDFALPGNPAALTAVLDGGTVAAAAESASSASAVDPTFSADLSTLFASFGTTAGADALSAALAEISAQLTADLANIVPQSLLGLF